MSEALALVLSGDGIGPLVAGGKGSALDRLIQLNARVPATGVITTAAYLAFRRDPTIAAFVDELRGSEVPDPSEHEAHRAEVDEVFLSAPLPHDVVVAVDGLVASVSGGGTVAVRSSATAEDLESASFAGQYESYLDVDSAGVHDALRLVWASLWYPAPRAYRRFRSIDETDLTMAVVVMRMLDPSHAGVLFTVDPGANTNAVRLEIVEGLGEQLVSGERTPEAHVIDRDGIVEAFGAISAPLADLAREAMRLERELGSPQDIEFAVHGGELFLVQARPITTTVGDVRSDDGFDFSCGNDKTYTTAGIAEMLPGVLGPLSWGVNSWLVENGFRYLFDLLGGGAEVLTHEHALIGRFRGRAALNLDAMRAAAGSVPGGSPEELEQQYFGEAVPSAETNRRCDEASERAGKGNAMQGVRVLRARRKAAEESEVVIQAVEHLITTEPDLTAFADAELMAYWNRLLHLAQRVVAVEVAVAAMASASYRSVEVFLSRYMDSAAASQAVQEVTSTDAADKRSRVALAVDPIVAQIEANDSLRGAVAEDWDETSRRLATTDAGRVLLEELSVTLRKAGSTGLFAGPTWDEVPQLAWMTIYQQLVHPSTTGAAAQRRTKRRALEEMLTSDPKWRWTRFVSGQLMDVRRKFLHREASDAAEFLQRREHTKAAVLILGGAVRRCHLEMGRRLLEQGRLETVADVEMLGVGEIGMLVGGTGPTLEEIARRRRRNVEADQGAALPLVWTGQPPEPTARVATGERFEGWSASPGRYEGRARVVHSAATSGLRRGEILVAATTDASWAPLFMAAGAVVVEQGGPLSHAAIVARELGMPAVANVPGLIARLERDGGDHQVVVDGTSGVVTIVGSEPDDDQTPRPSSEGPTSGPFDGPPRAPSPGLDETGGRQPTSPPPTGSRPTGPAAVVGYAPTRLPAHKWDETSPNFNVFVAGLMGAGALMSVLVGLTESISSTSGRARLSRRASPIAQMMAEGVTQGYDEVASSPTGLRPRRHYGLAAAAAGVLALFLALTSSDAYFSENGSVVGWALSLSGAVTVFAIAVAAAVTAARWPAVPSIVRRLAPGYPPRHRSRWVSLSRPARIAVIAMVGAVAVGAILVIVAESWVLKLDERLYFDWLEAGSDVDRWGPDWLNRLGQPVPAIVIAVAVSLMTLRCRIVAIAYPLAIVVGGLVNVTLSWITHRLRPPSSTHAGEFTSYPGGHSIQLPLLLLILPLAAYVVSERVWVRNLTGFLAAGVWAIAWLDTIRTGGHWPIDQLAGLLIAASLLVVVYSLARDVHQHESCDDCALAPEAPR